MKFETQKGQKERRYIRWASLYTIAVAVTAYVRYLYFAVQDPEALSDPSLFFAVSLTILLLSLIPVIFAVMALFLPSSRKLVLLSLIVLLLFNLLFVGQLYSIPGVVLTTMAIAGLRHY